jgi:hypothetical protein
LFLLVAKRSIFKEGKLKSFLSKLEVTMLTLVASNPKRWPKVSGFLRTLQGRSSESASKQNPYRACDEFFSFFLLA